MSMMAAIVSSSGRSSVGPKQTPKFDTVIRFLSALAATLQTKNPEILKKCSLMNEDKN
jgi:hypothetical protein